MCEVLNSIGRLKAKFKQRPSFYPGNFPDHLTTAGKKIGTGPLWSGALRPQLKPKQNLILISLLFWSRDSRNWAAGELWELRGPNRSSTHMPIHFRRCPHEIITRAMISRISATLFSVADRSEIHIMTVQYMTCGAGQKDPGSRQERGAWQHEDNTVVQSRSRRG